MSQARRRETGDGEKDLLVASDRVPEVCVRAAKMAMDQMSLGGEVCYFGLRTEY